MRSTARRLPPTRKILQSSGDPRPTPPGSPSSGRRRPSLRGVADSPPTSDDKDNEQEWVPGGPKDALGALLEFSDHHRADDNASFCITDRDKGLILWLDHGIVARVSGGQDPTTFSSIAAW
ncbi:DUF6357 family protein [Micromonospora sp. H61]|uniref:DUF6357 family protein n=1 Tax=unclassified Micromonospora TaxID=2617518 RepID=UPI001B38E9EE|nr:DUF6357 family protein [Micromonospora sp. H61]MBQ0988623.1 hypothetical protein [Micromonospora sp. H61]